MTVRESGGPQSAGADHLCRDYQEHDRSPRTFPDLGYVLPTRGDKMSQAVSSSTDDRLNAQFEKASMGHGFTGTAYRIMIRLSSLMFRSMDA
jgi:hypothetical protein